MSSYLSVLTQVAADHNNSRGGSPVESPTKSPKATDSQTSSTAAPATTAVSTSPTTGPAAPSPKRQEASPQQQQPSRKRKASAVAPPAAVSQQQPPPATTTTIAASTHPQRQPQQQRQNVQRQASFGPVKRRKTKWQKPASQPIMRAAVWEIRYGRARIVETALRYGIPLRTLRRYRDISKAGGTGYEEVDGKGVQFEPYLDRNGVLQPPLPPRTVKKYRAGFNGTLFEEDVMESSTPRRVERVQPGRGAALTAAALAADAAATVKRRKAANKKMRRNETAAAAQQLLQQPPIGAARLHDVDAQVALAKQALDAALLRRSNAMQAAGAGAGMQFLKPYMGQPAPFAPPATMPMFPMGALAQPASLMYSSQPTNMNVSSPGIGQFNGQFFLPNQVQMHYNPVAMQGYRLYPQQPMMMGPSSQLKTSGSTSYRQPDRI